MNAITKRHEKNLNSLKNNLKINISEKKNALIDRKKTTEIPIIQGIEAASQTEEKIKRLLKAMVKISNDTKITFDKITKKYNKDKIKLQEKANSIKDKDKDILLLKLKELETIFTSNQTSLQKLLTNTEKISKINNSSRLEEIKSGVEKFIDDYVKDSDKTYREMSKTMIVTPSNRTIFSEDDIFSSVSLVKSTDVNGSTNIRSPMELRTSCFRKYDNNTQVNENSSKRGPKTSF